MPNFNDDDVLSFHDGTVRFAKFKQALDIALSSKVPDALADSLSTQKLHLSSERQFRVSGAWTVRDRRWFQDGIDCETLRLSAPQWQKGKIRLRVVVEFVPDNDLDNPFEILGDAEHLRHHPGSTNGTHGTNGSNGTSGSHGTNGSNGVYLNLNNVH
ncbi:KGK domain-containing protein [Leptolyngbya sp. AN02str]|uniref:KGK domain-containing protein n=1 Tax=Leptolyngbya sp. AN02str TaxID=3423363 RepID=UPI003D312946